MHIPVLKKEVLQYLDPKPNENFIDCTIGEGGHTIAILEKNRPDGKILGIDQDPEITQCLKCKIKHFEERLILVCDNFVNLKEIVKREKFRPVSGIILDLGMSSWQLEESGRGFSFLKNEHLDMRYDTEVQSSKFKVQSLTAEKIVNKYSEKEIEKILKDYGEERFAKRIAEKIVRKREAKPIKSTFQLVDIIKKAIPLRYQHQRIHFATRTFQALRIAVNDELNNLKKALPQTIEVLSGGGRLVIISFHSLEDRIVKNFLKENYKKGLLKILTKKPIIPNKEEIKLNRRARSAKLRACLKF